MNVRNYEARSLELVAELPRYHEWLMRYFLPHLRGKVIEVGAGIGTVAASYVGAVDQAVLVEPAVNLHERLKARFSGQGHVTTLCSTLEEALSPTGQENTAYGRDPVLPGTFDAAIMVNVLEHIEDDRRVVKLLVELLKPGGALLIFVPATPLLFGEIDRSLGHVRRYTQETLGQVLTGVTVETMRYFDLLGMVPWFVTGRVLRRHSVGAASAKLYDRFFVPLCEVVDQLAGPRVGKNLVCVAFKNRPAGPSTRAAP
jgi:SAM-dependent methyltransferase